MFMSLHMTVGTSYRVSVYGVLDTAGIVMAECYVDSHAFESKGDNYN